MSVFEAPAKLNFSLLVSPPRQDGYHPIESVVQTVEWCDLLTIDQADEDVFEVEGAELDPEDNLVTKALRLVRETAEVPPQMINLAKEIPIGAGLGGGSSDAAAIFTAFNGWTNLDRVATEIGADVPLFRHGGSMAVGGIGEVIESIEPLAGFACPVVVPGFELATSDVYGRWDELEGPVGDPVPETELPPALRGGMPMRNDLLPAALSLTPELGDFIADVRAVWGTVVCLSGSGSACFGYFPSVDEATDAVTSVSHLTSVGKGVPLRPHGVLEV